MKTGFTGCRPNNRVATALVLEANLGIRISDVNLKLNDIVRMVTGIIWTSQRLRQVRKEVFTVPLDIYSYIQTYCINNGIKPDERIFPITERAVQKQLKIVCDWLGYTGVSTHSFRKFFATEIYKKNDFNIILVQQLLQHSTPAVTQKYIGISSKRD